MADSGNNPYDKYKVVHFSIGEEIRASVYLSGFLETNYMKMPDQLKVAHLPSVKNHSKCIAFGILETNFMTIPPPAQLQSPAIGIFGIDSSAHVAQLNILSIPNRL